MLEDLSLDEESTLCLSLPPLVPPLVPPSGVDDVDGGWGKTRWHVPEWVVDQDQDQDQDEDEDQDSSPPPTKSAVASEVRPSTFAPNPNPNANPNANPNPDLRVHSLCGCLPWISLRRERKPR